MRFSILLFFLTLSILSFSQNLTKEDWKNKYSILEKKYLNLSISEDQYLHEIDSLTEKLSISGLDFTRIEVIQLLDRFKTMAWSHSEKNSKYRANYYRFLMNNALSEGRSGEALFYAEKNEAENNKSGHKTLLIPFIELAIWIQAGNHEKVISLYSDHRSYFDTLLHHTTPHENNIKEYLHLMQYYSILMRPLLAEDNEWVNEVRDNIILTESIIQNHLPLVENTAAHPVVQKLLILYCNIDYYNHYKDRKNEKLYLDSAYVLIQKSNLEPTLNWNPIINNLHMVHLRYYLETKENDKAEIHLNALIRGVQIFDNEKSELYRLRSQLSLNKGLVSEAYELLDSALIYKTNELYKAYNEVTNLLYVHVESEHNKLELQQKDIIRKKQNIWIAVISLLAIGILIAAIFVLKKFAIKAKKQIKTLNKMTEIAIEEARIFAIKEEQKRFGQDLHDDFSGSLISILHNLDFIKQKAETEDIQQDLDLLKNRVNSVYQSIRKKSHHIYNKTTPEDDNTFNESITDIIDAVLSRKFHNAHIDIDNTASELLTLQQRIELLRILQEATTNILKHSKASEINIFLYNNDEEIIFQISDNGIGIRPLDFNKNGIGLDSIETRAKSLGGRLEVLTDEGTTLLIHIPI